MKNLKKSLTSIELKVFWDSYQKEYAKQQAKDLFPIFTSLYNLSNINSLINTIKGEINILDIACGTGEGIKYLIDNTINKNKNIKIYGTDLSSEMLKSTYDRLKCTKLNKYYSINFNKLIDVNSDVNLIECDNENLKFEHKKFDTVISNFSLHIVNNPLNMLKETHRVLKDKRSACFSLWGNPSNSIGFTVAPNTFNELNIELPKRRGYFHLGKIDNLSPLIKEAGFNNYYYHHSFVPFRIFDPVSYLLILENPVFKETYNKQDEETKQLICQSIISKVDKELSNNRLIGFDCLVVICNK